MESTKNTIYENRDSRSFYVYGRRVATMKLFLRNNGLLSEMRPIQVIDIDEEGLGDVLTNLLSDAQIGDEVPEERIPTEREIAKAIRIPSRKSLKGSARLICVDWDGSAYRLSWWKAIWGGWEPHTSEDFPGDKAHGRRSVVDRLCREFGAE